MRFSVIIPTYNAEAYVAECIESIKAQSFDDFECIIADDGSTDSSVSKCREAFNGDIRFRMLKQKHSCPASARNLGLDNAQGDYVLFVDSDDLLVPEALEKISSFAIQNDLSMVMFDAQIVKFKCRPFSFLHECRYLQRRMDYGIASGEEMLCRLIERKNFISNVFMHSIRRDCIKFRFPDIPLDEDTLYTFKNTASVPKAGHLREMVYVKRTRDGSVLNSRMTFEKTESLANIVLDIAQWVEQGMTDGTFSGKLPMAAESFLDSCSKEVKQRWNCLQESEKKKLNVLPFLKQTIFKRFIQ